MFRVFDSLRRYFLNDARIRRFALNLINYLPLCWSHMSNIAIEMFKFALLLIIKYNHNLKNISIIQHLIRNLKQLIRTVIFFFSLDHSRFILQEKRGVGFRNFSRTGFQERFIVIDERTALQSCCLPSREKADRPAMKRDFVARTHSGIPPFLLSLSRWKSDKKKILIGFLLSPSLSFTERLVVKINLRKYVNIKLYI